MERVVVFVKVLAKLLSFLGIFLGFVFLVHRGISWLYHNTLARYTVFDDERENFFQSHCDSPEDL